MTRPDLPPAYTWTIATAVIYAIAAQNEDGATAARMVEELAGRGGLSRPEARGLLNQYLLDPGPRGLDVVLGTAIRISERQAKGTGR